MGRRKEALNVQSFFADAAEFLPLLLAGVEVTLKVTFLSLTLSTVLGLIFALLRLSPVRWVSRVAFGVIATLRGIPILVQLLYIYFVFPEIGIQLSSFQAAVVGLGVGYSAYHAENIRAGILAVDRGQYEAAESLGMGKVQVMRRIILPQAVRIILPPYGNIMIMMLKDSSLASAITVAEITRAGQLIASSTFKNMTVFTLVAALYLALSLPLTALTTWLERKYKAK
jgi:polar amino acid transport system permease protein